MEYEDTFAEEDNDDIEIIQEGEDRPDPDVEENKEQENDEDQVKTVVKPKKRVVRPQIKLDATRLVGPRGIGILESTFKDIKFRGKGHELEDLNKTMQTLEHWAHRLFPKMTFDDVIDKVEDLGFKKNVMVHVTKIRLGMEDDVQPTEIPREEEEEVIDEPDPFDQLLSTVPKPPQTPSLTEEQRARMLRNRLIAEEIRMKKMKAREEALKAQASNVPSSDSLSELNTSSSQQDEVS